MKPCSVNAPRISSSWRATSSQPAASSSATRTSSAWVACERAAASAVRRTLSAPSPPSEASWPNASTSPNVSFAYECRKWSQIMGRSFRLSTRLSRTKSTGLSDSISKSKRVTPARRKNGMVAPLTFAMDERMATGASSATSQTCRTARTMRAMSAPAFDATPPPSCTARTRQSSNCPAFASISATSASA